MSFSKIVILAGIALLCHAPAAVAATTWQLATGYSADTFHTRNIQQFAEDVSKATAQGILIDVKPNNSLFKLSEIRQAVEEGKVQAGEVIMTSMVKEIPVAGADAIPFVVSSFSDVRRLWNLQRPLIEKHFEARGLKALYAVPWPPQGLYANAPVMSTRDFKGKSMRTYNQSTERIAQMLGARPVDVPMVGVRQALSEGRMDSMITSAVTGVENQVWSGLGYYYEINAWFPKNIVFVNLKAFNSLTPSEQGAIKGAAKEAEERGWAMSEATAADSTETLKARGIKVERIPLEFERSLKRIGETFSREWVRSVGNEANTIFVPYYFQR